MSKNKIVQLSTIIYCLTGLYGALWLSDDMDSIKKSWFGYFAVPFCGAYFLVDGLIPFFFQTRLRLKRILLSTLLVLFLPGHLLLINANFNSTSPINRKIGIGQKVVAVEMKRGALGLLFSYRW